MDAFAKKLWALKGFFLFYWAAYACTAPYLPIFANESIGLNSKEFGVIFGIVPFISMLCRPLLGLMGDKYNAHRSVLIFCLLLQFAFVLVMYYIPGLPSSWTIPFNASCDAHGERMIAEEFVVDCKVSAICRTGKWEVDEGNVTHYAMKKFVFRERNGLNSTEAKYGICKDGEVVKVGNNIWERFD